MKGVKPLLIREMSSIRLKLQLHIWHLLLKFHAWPATERSIQTTPEMRTLDLAPLIRTLRCPNSVQNRGSTVAAKLNMCENYCL